MSFDDHAADYGRRPPPHPDDRLWRHPSEMAQMTASVAPPVAGHAGRRRGLHWGAIATMGTASVLLAGAAAFLVGVRSPGVGTGSSHQAGAVGLGTRTTATTSTLVTPTSSATFLEPNAARSLGIEVRDAPEAGGVTIDAVDPEGPAADSGLTTDDVIVDVDGTPVTDTTALTAALSGHGSGDVVEVTVQPADGDAITVELTVGAITDATSTDD